MDPWKQLLAQMDSRRAMERATGLLDQKTVYHLGRGGFDRGVPKRWLGTLVPEPGGTGRVPSRSLLYEEASAL